MSGSSVLIQFCIRAVFGLGVVLALLSPNEIDPWYFRTQALVALALALLAGLAGLGWPAWLLVTVAWAAFFCWSVGWQRAGRVSLAVLAVGAFGCMWAWRSGEPALWWWLVAEGSSAVAVVAIYAAMLLGHWYLVWPWMSIVPLLRLLRQAAVALGLRAVVAGLDWSLAFRYGVLADSVALAVCHVGIGLFGGALGLVLAWRCAAIRSTQSATGILYAATAMGLLGELAAAVAAARSGWPI